MDSFATAGSHWVTLGHSGSLSYCGSHWVTMGHLGHSGSYWVTLGSFGSLVRNGVFKVILGHSGSHWVTLAYSESTVTFFYVYLLISPLFPSID